MTRRGWSLPELIVSLAILGIIVGVSSHAAALQLRFFRGIGEVAAVRTQTGHAADIAARLLGGASGAAGDVLVAQDSVVEIRAPIAMGLLCADGAGSYTVAAPGDSGGNALGMIVQPPRPGDFVDIFTADSTGAGWITARLADVVSGSSCERFAGAEHTWSIRLEEPLFLPAGAVMRFVRILRLSAYRASDRRWYVGLREWASDGFGSVQPVAGPLDPVASESDTSGFRLVYRDRSGGELAEPADRDRIATITLVLRGRSLNAARIPGKRTSGDFRHRDSSVIAIALDRGGVP